MSWHHWWVTPQAAKDIDTLRSTVQKPDFYNVAEPRSGWSNPDQRSLFQPSDDNELYPNKTQHCSFIYKPEAPEWKDTVCVLGALKEGTPYKPVIALELYTKQNDTHTHILAVVQGFWARTCELTYNKPGDFLGSWKDKPLHELCTDAYELRSALVYSLRQSADETEFTHMD